MNERYSIIVSRPAPAGYTPDTMHVVEMYQDGLLIHSRALPGKSIYYVQDVVDNWESGLLYPELLKNTAFSDSQV